MIRENHREPYNEYIITVNYTKTEDLVEDRIYQAEALKNGMKCKHFRSAISFEDAIAHLKPILDFKLSVDDFPQKKSKG